MLIPQLSCKRDHPAMGFNRRKMEDDRRRAAEKKRQPDARSIRR